jgi:hypothetical protein
MSAWVPKWKKTGVMPAAAPVKPGVKFIGNATGNTNEAPNTNVRYSPKRNAVPAKKTLKATKHVSPNAAPPAKPTAIFQELPAKFQTMIKLFYRNKPKTPKKTRRRSSRRSGQKKPTRRRHTRGKK